MRSFLERLKDIGAHPLLLAQNRQQRDDGAGTFTPLEITAPGDIKEEREEWRKIYTEVFNLGDLKKRGSQNFLAHSPPAPQIQPEPEQQQDFVYVINVETGLALTAQPTVQQDGTT